MARELKTNTAIIVTVGPFLSITDGVTLQTALTITNEKISFVVDLDNGNAPTLVLDNITGATSGTANDLNYIANCDAALMQIELAAANVNYLGRARLTITDAAHHMPVWEDFEIVSAQYFDAKYGTGNFSADAKAIGGTTQTGRDLGASVLLSSGTGAGQLDFTSGVVKANLVQILAAAITGTAANLVASFTAFFNVASPVHTCASVNQTGDSFARLGTPAGASIEADIASIKVDTGTTIPGKLPSALSAGGMIKADIEEYKATACPTADTAGYPKVTIKVGTGTGEVNLASGKVPATIAAGDIATDAITADALKADAATEIVHALLDHALSAHLTSGTVGESLAAYPGKKVVVNNQLIQYAANNITELFRFNLFAADGSTPTMTDVYYAVRV